jgi:hypothetical protein
MGLLQYTAINLTLMLLGMALLKWRVLAGERSASCYLLLMAVGYGIGLPLRAGDVWSSWATTFDSSVVVWQPFGELARIAITLGHLGLFLLLWNAVRQSRAMRALAAAGRMAFTNYVAQTMIAMRSSAASDSGCTEPSTVPRSTPSCSSSGPPSLPSASGGCLAFSSDRSSRPGAASPTGVLSPYGRHHLILQ